MTKFDILYFLCSMLNYRTKRLNITKISIFKESEEPGKSDVKAKYFFVKQLPITYYWDLSDNQ